MQFLNMHEHPQQQFMQQSKNEFLSFLFQSSTLKTNFNKYLKNNICIHMWRLFGCWMTLTCYLDSIVDFAVLGSKSGVCVAEQTAKKKIMTYCSKNRANVANSPIIR